MKVRLITRPRLAARIMARGIQVEQTINPFATEECFKKAWNVPDTEEVRQIVREYFDEERGRQHG